MCVCEERFGKIGNNRTCDCFQNLTSLPNARWDNSNSYDGNDHVSMTSLCYNYYSDSYFEDMCTNIFSAQALALTAVSILFIALIIRLCSLCCCPISWGRPRCCVRSCSSIAVSMLIFLGLMLAVTAESLWSAAMTDLEVDVTLYTTSTPALSASTSLGTGFVLMSLASTTCLVWLCMEVYALSVMVRNRNGYQALPGVSVNMAPTVNMPPAYSDLVVSGSALPPPGYQTSYVPPVTSGMTTVVSAPGGVNYSAGSSSTIVYTTAPMGSSSSAVAAAAAAVPPPSSSSAAAVAAAAAGGAVMPSAPVKSGGRFCGSCGVEVSTKFCPNCGSPAM